MSGLAILPALTQSPTIEGVSGVFEIQIYHTSQYIVKAVVCYFPSICKSGAILLHRTREIGL